MFYKKRKRRKGKKEVRDRVLLCQLGNTHRAEQSSAGSLQQLSPMVHSGSPPELE